MDALDTQVIVTWREGDPLDMPLEVLADYEVVVRLTGGVRITLGQRQHLMAFFAQAFRDVSCGLVSGGVQECVGEAPSAALSITHVAPYLCTRERGVSAIAVMPGVLHQERTRDGVYAVQRNEKGDVRPGWRTFIAPEYRCVLLMGQSPMQRSSSIWDDEVWLCQSLLERLQAWRLARTFTVAYSGGEMTRRELELAADAGRDVVVIAGSGGVCDTLSADSTFIAHRNVHVIGADQPEHLRQVLIAGLQ
jgi:hypothetical protein